MPRCMKTYIALLAVTLSLGAFARGDEIQFTTLPQPLQTSVIRETHISGPTAVARVIRENGGVYAVTVRENEGTRVVCVNESGPIVQAPSSTTTTTTTTTEPTEEQVVTYEEVQRELPRYQLIKRSTIRKYIWIGRRVRR